MLRFYCGCLRPRNDNTEFHTGATSKSYLRKIYLRIAVYARDSDLTQAEKDRPLRAVGVMRGIMSAYFNIYPGVFIACTARNFYGDIACEAEGVICHAYKLYFFHVGGVILIIGVYKIKLALYKCIHFFHVDAGNVHIRHASESSSPKRVYFAVLRSRDS